MFWRVHENVFKKSDMGYTGLKFIVFLLTKCSQTVPKGTQSLPPLPPECIYAEKQEGAKQIHTRMMTIFI
jgi:hypothetical protein